MTIFKGIPPKQLFTSNAKLKRDGIYSFGIPAFRSASGFVTCPAAAKCIKGCYARNGFYVMPSVKAAQELRLALTLDAEFFIAIADTEIRKRKIKRLRIHDSGDFYSAEYRDTWFKIMHLNPDTAFYAYTKNWPLFQGAKLPPNFTVIYSEGGKHDKEYKSSDRHSRVFKTRKQLLAAGYVDTSHNDINAIGKSKRIGLVYHGGKSKAWSTAAK